MNQGGRRRAPARNSAPKKTSGKIEPLHPSAEPPDITSFREWPLTEEIQRSIEDMGIQTPTPIQRLAIGPVLAGKDVIAKAETGTGKTLAFGAPMMSKIDATRSSVLGLVMCPTRELAQQVCAVLVQLGAARGIKVALIVGGEPMHPQVDALKAGAQVVVGTPGRILDLYNQKFLSFPWTEFAILDEADEMLEIGFIDDVKMILSFTPEERQTLLFSATYPDEVLTLARESTRDPVEVATASGVKTVDTIEQGFVKVDEEDRALTLIRLIEQSTPEDVFLVFCARRTDVDQLMRKLERQAFPVKALHGGFDQAARFRVMSAFRTGEVKALVATDVASRGLDVKHVSHVVNFSVPQDISDYTHRIGRTGRAGRSGTAITFVSRRDFGRWQDIQAQATWNIAEMQPPSSRQGALRRPARTTDAHAPRQAFPADHSRDRQAPRGRAWPQADENVVAPHGENLRRESSAAPAARRAAPTQQASEHASERGRPRRESASRGPVRARQAEARDASQEPASVSDRQRRALSTRERLRLEREQSAHPARPARTSSGPAATRPERQTEKPGGRTARPPRRPPGRRDRPNSG